MYAISQLLILEFREKHPRNKTFKKIVASMVVPSLLVRSWFSILIVLMATTHCATDLSVQKKVAISVNDFVEAIIPPDLMSELKVIEKELLKAQEQRNNISDFSDHQTKTQSLDEQGALVQKLIKQSRIRVGEIDEKLIENSKLQKTLLYFAEFVDSATYKPLTNLEFQGFINHARRFNKNVELMWKKHLQLTWLDDDPRLTQKHGQRPQLITKRTKQSHLQSFAQDMLKAIEQHFGITLQQLQEQLNALSAEKKNETIKLPHLKKLKEQFENAQIELKETQNENSKIAIKIQLTVKKAIEKLRRFCQLNLKFPQQLDIPRRNTKKMAELRLFIAAENMARTVIDPSQTQSTEKEVMEHLRKEAEIYANTFSQAKGKMKTWSAHFMPTNPFQIRLNCQQSKETKILTHQDIYRFDLRNLCVIHPNGYRLTIPIDSHTKIDETYQFHQKYVQKIKEFDDKSIHQTNCSFEIAKYWLYKSMAITHYTDFIYMHLLHQFPLIALNVSKLKLFFDYASQENIECATDAHQFFQRFKKRLIHKKPMNITEPYHQLYAAIYQRTEAWINELSFFNH